MSLEVRKVNRPGVGGSFGSNRKTSGVSSQATKNLANASAANSSTTISFRSGRKIGWVAGQNNIKNRNKVNYQGTRASLNARTYNPSGPTYYGTTSETTTYTINNGSKAYNTGQVIGSVLNGTFSILNKFGVFDGLKSDNTTTTKSASQTLDKAFSSLSKTPTATTLSSSTASAAITSMSSATDSATLSSAIQSAESTYSTMETQANEGNYKTELENKKSNLDKLEKDLNTAEKNTQSAQQELKTADETVTARKNIRDSKKLELQKKDKAYADASAKYEDTVSARVSAESNLASAQSTLSALEPRTTENAVAYDNAKKAVDTAKEKLEQAKKEENNAKTAKEEAKQAADAAGKEVSKAEEELNKAEDNLKDAKSIKEEKEKALVEAEKASQEATKALNDAEIKYEQYEAHLADMKDLKSQIDREKERLTELEQEENEKYDKYDTKMEKEISQNNNRANTIQGDVDTFKEKWTSKRIAKTNEKIEENSVKRDHYGNLSDQTYIRNELIKTSAITGADGSSYRTGVNPETMNTVYSKDGVMITKEEYELAIQNASA